MKQLLGHLLGIVLVSTSSMVMVYSQSPKPAPRQTVKAPSQSGALVEEFSFLIRDFKMDHQTQTNNLNISISYRYVNNATKSDYPDFRWLAKDIETFLTDYPNDDDYWEIVNKQITSMLLKKYAGLASITSEIRVDPSPQVAYTRTSRVTRRR
ncbi:MAG TPA: hypothetical protein VFS76_12945 [Pyrinomonadaceae bacterium]|nr:hypothetical protein [Pyrinomonadaceae bacterium]